MRKTIAFLFLFLLQGCTFNNPFSPSEIDKVAVVTYTPYMRQHRAFLSRSTLKIIKNNNKYLYLYHTKNNALAVLVQRRNTFFLYTLSNPKEKIYTLMTFRGEKYAYALNHFKSLGYRPLINPATKGFLVTVSHQRYKGIKTLLFDVKDYTRLLRLYKMSIRTYNANTIKNIKTILPKSLILGYYKYYEKKAKYKKQQVALNIIANKLQLKGFVPTKKTTQNTNAKTEVNEKSIQEKQSQKETLKNKSSSSWYDFHTNTTEDAEEKEKIVVKKVIKEKPTLVVPYNYYLHKAPAHELRSYLSKRTTKTALSASRYVALKQREKSMKEEKLLKTGTLEELIAAYKRNHKPKFKQRILSLMREKQK